MKHNCIETVLIIMTAMPVLLLSSCKSNDSYLTINGYAQGGTFKVTYSMPSSGKQSVKALEDSIKSELVLIDDTFSGYNKGSEITRVNEAGSDTVEVNATFAELFGKSKTIWEESSGAFDPSGAPIFDIWGFGFSNKGKVTQHQIDSLKQFVGMDKIRIDSIGGRFYIIKSDPRIKLNFNAIAQGYTCDCIARILDSFGVGNYLVDLGEIVCKGVNGKGMKWIIGVEHPEDGNQTKGKAIQTIVSVTNCGIVTSGNYRKFYIENGKKYAHTIDPRTGYPAQQSLLSATAICKDGTTADAYATWFMVIGTDSAKAVLSRMPDTKAILIYDEDGSMKVWSNAE